MSPLFLFSSCSVVVISPSAILAALGRASVEGFFGGMNAQGGAHRVWTTCAEQVTRGIFRPQPD